MDHSNTFTDDTGIDYSQLSHNQRKRLAELQLEAEDRKKIARHQSMSKEKLLKQVETLEAERANLLSALTMSVERQQESQKRFKTTIYSFTNEALRISGFCRAFHRYVVQKTIDSIQDMHHDPPTLSEQVTLQVLQTDHDRSTETFSKIEEHFSNLLTASCLDLVDLPTAEFVRFSIQQLLDIGVAVSASDEEWLMNWIDNSWTEQFSGSSDFSKVKANELPSQGLDQLSGTLSEATLLLAGILDRKMRKDLVAMEESTG